MAASARPVEPKALRSSDMNLPTEIPALEVELNHVLRIYEEEEKRLAQSTTPEIDRIFFASTKKLRHEIEERLRRAKRTDGTK